MKVKREQSGRPVRVIRTLGVNDLARELGLTPAHVSQVMSGKRTSRRVSDAARGRLMTIEHGEMRHAV